MTDAAPRYAPAGIRRLHAADAGIYRTLRLEALQAHPDAFSASLESEREQTLAWFAARLSADAGEAAVFGAFAGETALGMAGFFRESGPKQRHRGTLWTMYVRPAARGTGAGDLLVAAVIDHARQHVEMLDLAVGNHNRHARALYERHGFRAFALDEKALKLADGRYIDEIFMRIALRL